MRSPCAIAISAHAIAGTARCRAGSRSRSSMSTGSPRARAIREHRGAARSRTRATAARIASADRSAPASTPLRHAPSPSRLACWAAADLLRQDEVREHADRSDQDRHQHVHEGVERPAHATQARRRRSSTVRCLAQQMRADGGRLPAACEAAARRLDALGGAGARCPPATASPAARRCRLGAAGCAFGEIDGTLARWLRVRRRHLGSLGPTRACSARLPRRARVFGAPSRVVRRSASLRWFDRNAKYESGMSSKSMTRSHSSQRHVGGSCGGGPMSAASTSRTFSSSHSGQKYGT